MRHVLAASIRDFRLARTPECKYHHNVEPSWFFAYKMHLYVAAVSRSQVSTLSDEEVVRGGDMTLRDAFLVFTPPVQEYSALSNITK